MVRIGVTENQADWIHSIDRKKGKARRYIDDPSEAPDDVEVEEGPHGGLYYEVEGTPPVSEEAEEAPEKPGPGDHAYFDAVINIAGQEIDISDTPVEIVEVNREHGAVIINHPEYGSEILREEDINDIEPASEDEIVEPPEEEESEPEEEEAFREELPPVGDITDSEPLDIQTAEEAQDYIQSHITDSVRKINELPDGSAVQVANSLKRQVEEIGVEPPKEVIRQYLSGAVASYNNDNLYLSTQETPEEYTEKKRFMYSDGTRAFQGDTIESVVTHEMGHKLDAQLNRSRSLRKRRNRIFERGIGFNDEDIQEQASKVSHYAGSAPEEYFAEAWTAYIHEDHEVLSDEVIEFFDDVRDYLKSET